MSTEKPSAANDPQNSKAIPKRVNIAVLDKLLDVPADPKNANATLKSSTNRKNLRRMKLRHKIVALSFGVTVLVPTVVSGAYMAFVAADQYQSSAAFAVRSIDGKVGSDILGMFTQGAGASSTSSDSYMLLDYIRSESMIAAVSTKIDIDEAFAQRGADLWYAMQPNLPVEDRLDYWRQMININYDHTSSILTLSVKAFAPSTAQAIASGIIAESERLINDLSLEARAGVLRASRDEVELAEGRLTAARMALRNFRDISQVADPVEAAKLAGQLVANLEQQLTQLKTELTTARTRMSTDSPRIRVMTAQIQSLEKQLNEERQRFGSGKTSRENNGDVASRIQQYEALETEREFAEKAYTGALGSLEKARIDANNQQRYLATFIKPTMSEMAQYPTRFLNTLLVFLACLFLWGVAVMGYYNIRDRN